jgi:hypothetical protein
MTVTQLGRIFQNGNTHNHTLRVVRVSNKTVAASVTWSPAGGSTGNQHVP